MNEPRKLIDSDFLVQKRIKLGLEINVCFNSIG